MQKIIPHLWYDKEAKEAAEFYVSVFPESKITSYTVLKGTPSGDCDVMAFNLWGNDFMSISAGPYFKLNPSISFIVGCDTKEQVDGIWEKLNPGGTVRMPIDKYPFSEWYGWVEDKYGVNWQLILTKPEGEMRPRIVPSLMFTGDKVGKADEAIDFYVNIFKGKRGATMRYGAGQEPEKEGNVTFADFELLGTWLAAMESAQAHKFTFNEAVSLMVSCDTQEEIDEYWSKLSAVPEAEQCGWLKDKYGVSWQINPSDLQKIMESGDQAKIDRVTQAFLKMKKFDIAELEKAAKG